MRWRSSELLTAVAALVLGGCAGASTDPHTGGLAGGLTGLATGAYDKRLQDREAAIADLQQAENSLTSRLSASQDRLAGLDRQIAARKGSLQRMKAELKAIDQSIARVRSEIGVGQDTLRGAQSSNAVKAQALAPLEAERDTLARMVAELEGQHQLEAQAYEQMKKAPPASGGVAVADLEKRWQMLDQKSAQALARIEQLKSATGQLGAT